MDERRLGKSLVVSFMGLGCMRLTDLHACPDPLAAEATIRRAVERGVTFFDTADVYSDGDNERLLGRALAPVRDKVVVATKFGSLRAPDGTLLGICGRPDHVRASCEGSLKRLGVETIDLYIQHRIDPVVPVEETIGEMARLVDEGKVRFLGLSEAAPATIRRAHAVHRLAAVQSEYSLWTRDVEADVLPCLRELGIGFIPASPLGRGFLTGALRKPEDIPAGDARHRQPRFFGENFGHNLALVSIVEEMAGRLRCSPAQLSLAFVLAQGSDVVPIPGATDPSQVDENLGALDVPLSAADLARLQKAVPPGSAAGQRYGPRQMETVNR